MCNGPIHPDPKVWPECPTCQTAYILRRGFSFGLKGEGVRPVWSWMRDCKHKTAPGDLTVRDERDGKPAAKAKKKASRA